VRFLYAVTYPLLTGRPDEAVHQMEALAFCEKTTPRAFPHVIGLLAGLLKRTGDSRRSEELPRKLQPGDACGALRGLAAYPWVLREFEAEADWFEKAID
jgi:hypothetical protein